MDEAGTKWLSDQEWHPNLCTSACSVVTRWSRTTSQAIPAIEANGRTRNLSCSHIYKCAKSG